MFSFEPLRITAHLVSPVAGDITLPIDGILLATAARLHYGEPPAVQAGQALPFDPEIVPLALIDTPVGWMYSASFAQWPAAYTAQLFHWHKRFDTEEALSRTTAKRIDTGAGAYRAYRQPLTTRSALQIDWYVFGDEKAIRALLDHVLFIGKKTAQGFGQVRRWEIARVDEDKSLIQNQRVMRAIPVAFLPEGDWGIRAYRAFRPPYWVLDNLCDVYVPYTV